MAAANTPSSEELDLRRRARRRLIGAIALALVVIVVLPMLFEPEPKPLGEDVDIRIPGQDTPFQQPVAPPAPDLKPSAPAAAEQTQPPAAAMADATVKPVAPSVVAQAATAQPAKAESAKSEPVKAVTSPAKADKPSKTEPKPIEKPAAKPVDKTAKKDEAKPASPTPTTSAKSGYFVQLGVFGNEQNAKQLADKLGKTGYKAKIVHAGGQSRVWVGPYAEKQQALEVQAKLKSKAFSPVLIAP